MRRLFALTERPAFRAVVNIALFTLFLADLLDGEDGLPAGVLVLVLVITAAFVLQAWGEMRHG